MEAHSSGWVHRSVSPPFACQVKPELDELPDFCSDEFDPCPWEAETEPEAPQPLKEAAAATFIDLAFSLLLPLAVAVTSSVAKSRPPSCTLVLKNSPEFGFY